MKRKVQRFRFFRGCILFLFLVALQPCFGQNSISLSVQDEKLSEVFDAIEAQSNVHFIYKSSDVNSNQLVTLNVRNASIKQVMDQLFANTNITYNISGNEVYLTSTGNAATSSGVTTVEGVVLNETGDPLIGASVLSIRTKNVAITDAEGRYVLQASDNDNILFSYIGYQEQVLAYNGEPKVNMTLYQDEYEIDAVIATGYQDLAVNESTGAVGQLQGSVIDKKGYADVLQSLEGMVAGLAITTDPISGNRRVDIRGISTLSGNAQPLIVVDGFPIEGGLDTVNPYEIESINVLKDASAASIYGARSANGVVVITTKKGAKGRIRTNFRTQFAMMDKPDLSYRLHRLGSQDLVTALKAAYKDSDPHTYQWYQANDDYFEEYQYARNLVFETMAKVNEGLMSQKDAEAYLNTLSGIDNTKQWEDKFYQNPMSTQYNIGISGGGSVNTFRSSLNYTKSNNYTVGDKSDRLIFDLLNNLELNQKVSLQLGANVVYNNNKQTPFDFDNIQSINPFERIFDDQGNPLSVRKAYGGGNGDNYGYYGGKDPLAIQQLIDNKLLDETYIPLNDLDQYPINQNVFSSRLQTRLNYNMTDFLSGNLGFQYETSYNNTKEIWEKDSWRMHNLINNTTPLSYTGDPEQLNIPLGSRVITNNNRRNSYTLRGQLNFNKDFGQWHAQGIAGSEVRHIQSRTTGFDKFGYDDNSLLFKDIDKQRLSEFIGDVYHPKLYIGSGLRFYDRFVESTDRFFSGYSNANFGYDNRYIVSGSIRIDQSNLFGTDPKYRYKPFWSIGGKWRVNEEAFFTSKTVNNLALRFSNGVNGNISNSYGPYNIASALFSSRAGGVQSLAVRSPAIYDLRWERSNILDFGVDIGLWDNRLDVTLDYYNKKTDDVLAYSSADPTLGFPSLIHNDADISNKGFEVSLNSLNIKKKNWNWSTLWTFRTNKSLVTKVYSDRETAYSASGLYNYEGGPMLSYWLYDYKGLNDAGEVVIYDKDGEEYVVDNTDFYQLDRDNLKNFGPSIPKMTGGLTNNFEVGNFGLSFLFVGSSGHKLFKDSYNGEEIDRASPFLINADFKKAWKKPGDEAFTNIPATGTYRAGVFAARNSQKNLISGDYVRLRELIATYHLPQQLLDKSNISNVELFLRGNNLYLWTKNKEGIDPEAHAFDTRLFKIEPGASIGLSVNF